MSLISGFCRQPPSPHPLPQGRCAWRSEGLGWPQSAPLTHLCDRPGGQEGRGPRIPARWTHGDRAGGQAPGADPELAAALLASPPVLQPNREGVKHIKDPLNVFISSVSGVLNQILFFKSIWADGLTARTRSATRSTGVRQFLCRSQPVCAQQKPTRDQGWKHRVCLKPLQKRVLRNRPKNSFPGKS